MQSAKKPKFVAPAFWRTNCNGVIAMVELMSVNNMKGQKFDHIDELQAALRMSRYFFKRANCTIEEIPSSPIYSIFAKECTKTEKLK